MSVPDFIGLQLAKCTNVAALAILVYDYFITLNSEVQWIWGRKWGIIRIAFTISRYAPIAGALMTSYSAFKTWGMQDCTAFNDATNGMHFLGFIASEGLLICRVYAFSGKQKACLISLLSFGSVILVASVILSAAPIHLNISGPVPPPCMFEGSRRSALPYALLTFFEIVLMSVTVFLRYRHYLGSHTALVEIIYRDGLLYIFCIMMMSTGNVIVTAVLPVSSSFVTVNLEELSIPHSSRTRVAKHTSDGYAQRSCSRILFNLQANRETYQLTNSIELLSLPHEFQAQPGGSMIADPSDEV
ncbi:hypothetical protein BDR07DRAFT_1614035 [Suillus spraguei]|nr:hypothetical protein BDR07DRAFT_1614035 [Suillus spraguei]